MLRLKAAANYRPSKPRAWRRTPHQPFLHPTQESRTKSYSSTSSHDLQKFYQNRFANDRDNQLIRSMFDQPWVHRSHTQDRSQSTGIFDYPQLRTPGDLFHETANTILRARLVVNRICRSFNPSHPHFSPKYSQENPKLAFLDCIQCFDRLSDALCRIIDLSELVRNLHSDPEWARVAHEAHSILCRYMNTLNTHAELYGALKFTISRLPATEEDDPRLFAAKTVGMQFLRDFERHGIHLPQKSRERLVELSDKMLKVGREFFAGTSSSDSSPTYITKSEAKMISSGFVENFEEFTRKGDVLTSDDELDAEIDPADWKAHAILRQHPSQSVRRRIWTSQHQSSDVQIGRLESLLRLRSQFAELTGKSSWAEVVLEDKMINKPEDVMKFLTNLNAQVLPLARNEIKLLQQIQSKTATSESRIEPWDRDYYANILKSQDRSSSLTSFSHYFSVGTCIQGLSRLFTLIYGIHFRVETIKPTEVWDPSVIKLGVIDENEGRIGTIYCDLFGRSDGSKPHGAAHYTVLCSRRTDLDDDLKDFEFRDDGFDESDYRNARFLNVPVEKRRGLPGTYQRPIVVFSCAFDPPDPASRQPSLLSWSDVETLFHEMGHAMHSMLGQTEYHNVSGTRCATDFVELPSIMMERFARSPQVLSLFARHYADDRPLDVGLFGQHIVQQRARMKGLETNAQIVMAALDQGYHSDVAGRGTLDSTAEYARVGRTWSVFGESAIAGSAAHPHRWHGRFGHLYGYGASYYAYLFDRVISEKLWAEIFSATHPQHPAAPAVLSRLNGERFRSSVLAWGGARLPWHSLGELLNDPVLYHGGSPAVDRVGKWGLSD